MFAKLAFVVLGAGATAAGLLVLRQQRIETSHEMSRVHGQIMTHERALWHLRSEIAGACGPEAVRERLEDLGGEWVPIALETDPEDDTSES
jgi:hypothetical protein